LASIYFIIPVYQLAVAMVNNKNLNFISNRIIKLQFFARCLLKQNLLDNRDFFYVVARRGFIACVYICCCNLKYLFF